ncbi:hypothetical protein A3I35_03115 [Candidatus Falkowbacteria bacterium RIFCSPLOWO2_02_FULL_45_15]|uniref:Uncharacterized protein n=2 Tax=Candidatus Falkowiibacteriota TaxID=1752728 RepID=A0A1F5RZ52_9BACT|nr:MAG: hypothetical protein A3I35_03115 [Candidatus Falkowbacteria bacterium RIFCSPLOWO2_02_FULL_45_15]OGF19719.1 MAG: hypothetical protein A3D54_02320 [Candidatus Falkowbacteria bacterium RIFCSPHIGHO2_02_FULL_45_15]
MVYVTVEIINPCSGESQCHPLIALVDKIFSDQGCRITTKNHHNGSILVKGKVSSLTNAQSIKGMFCNGDGSVKEEYQRRVLAVNW